MGILGRRLELLKENYMFGTGHGPTWHVNINPPTRKVKTYFEETVEAFEYIYHNKTGKFQVLYSGGLDSQYVCEVLLHLKMPFEAIIVYLIDNESNVLNHHDIIYAHEFCKIKKLDPIIYKFNFYNFVESGKNVEIAESVSCCAYGLPAWMHIASRLDGYSLLGHDPPYIRYKKDQNRWFLEELEFAHSLLRFYAKYKLNGCPFTLMYTSEMMLSFLLDSTIIKLGQNQIPGKEGSNSSKSYVFNHGSNFNMPVYDYVKKTRIKQNGFEKLPELELWNHPNMKIFQEYQKKWNGVYYEPYHDVVKRLSVNQ
jgi:hypothetical protein